MNNLYRNPEIEPGVSNVVLQNRCGNRLTLIVHDDHTDLEFIYKPNAYRRKEFRARNFSNRDNYTTLFAWSAWPEIGVNLSPEFDYDPFVTRINLKSATGARNQITVVNVADENVFAISARAPLALAFRPHQRFEARDGLLAECFDDRGESIVSFIKFDSFEANRYRVLDDGTHVLQLVQDDLVLVGAEENSYQVDRIVGQIGGLTIDQLKTRNERVLRPLLSRSRLQTREPDTQRVIDLNRRVVASGIDAGGACFGALNRIYHLIWVRDGSMTTTHLALSGVPEFLRVWTPFLLSNPTVRRNESGVVVREYLQAVGTAWTKAEDDGIYYATFSLFTLVQTTGRRELLEGPEFQTLLEAVDYAIATRFVPSRELMGSDTRGESTLATSPLYGFDAVNGKMDAHRVGTENAGRTIAKAFSLYQNVNFFNVLRMSLVLIDQSGVIDDLRKGSYTKLAALLSDSLARHFCSEDHTYRADLLVYSDGSEEWVDFKDADHWEYAWAVSQGPFHAHLPTALRSARKVVETWPTIRNYGYCPWNTLARMLKEFGQNSRAFADMLRQEVRDALTKTVKYPMLGALTEYQKDVESWRALPFSAGSFILAQTSCLLQTLPMGIAVRASDHVTRVDSFERGLSALTVQAPGIGDQVESVLMNDSLIEHTLQIPENRLRKGINRVVVTRTLKATVKRLYASTATLLSAEGFASGQARLILSSPVPVELIFENMTARDSIVARNKHGQTLALSREAFDGERFTLVRLAGGEEFEVVFTTRSSVE